MAVVFGFFAVVAGFVAGLAAVVVFGLEAVVLSGMDGVDGSIGRIAVVI